MIIEFDKEKIEINSTEIKSSNSQTLPSKLTVLPIVFLQI